MDVIFSTETTTENAAESAEETPEFPLPVVDEPVVDNFPDELLECDNWVVWRYEWKKNNRHATLTFLLEVAAIRSPGGQRRRWDEHVAAANGRRRGTG